MNRRLRYTIATALARIATVLARIPGGARAAAVLNALATAILLGGQP